MIEVEEIYSYQLQDYLNKGYEFISIVIYSDISTIPIREEVPDNRVVVSDSAGGYYNHQPVYINKNYPTSNISTKILVKRSLAAKLLYEKSLKNENNA